MGKLNEIQEQMTQSYGSNSFTTTIKDTTVEFDSAKDKFTFKDPIEVPSITVNGQESVAFTSEDRTKLDNLQTPMQIQGRVDSVAELPTEGVKVGDTYLVGLSGSETFDEYVCVELSGSPESPVWESVGTTQVQSDWNQNDNTKADYIKNRICYQNIVSRGYSSNDADAQEVYDEWGDKIGWYTPNANITESDVLSFVGRNLTAVYEYETVEHTIESYSEPFSGWFGLKQISTNVYAIYSTVDDDYIAAISLADGEEGMLGFETLNKGVYFSAILESYNMDGISEYVTLDDNYISSNIARVSDIKQSDWNQNDSSAADFIKNRIAYLDSATFYETDSVSQYFNWDEPLAVSNSIYIAYTLGPDSSTPGDFVEGPLTSIDSTSFINVAFNQGALFYYPGGGQGGGNYNGNFSGNPYVTKIKVYSDNSKTIDTGLIPAEVLNDNAATAKDITFDISNGTYIVDFSKSSGFKVGTSGSLYRLYFDCSNCKYNTKYEFTFLGQLVERSGDATVSRFIEVHNASSHLGIYSNIQSYTTGYYYLVKVIFMKGSAGGTDMLYADFIEANQIQNEIA